MMHDLNMIPYWRRYVYIQHDPLSRRIRIIHVFPCPCRFTVGCICGQRSSDIFISIRLEAVTGTCMRLA